IDLAEDDIDHAIEHVLLVPYVVIERHRLDAELVAELAHAERLESASIGEADGGTQDPLPGQGCAALCRLFSLRRHCFTADSIHRKSIQAYAVCGTLTQQAYGVSTSPTGRKEVEPMISTETTRTTTMKALFKPSTAPPRCWIFGTSPSPRSGTAKCLCEFGPPASTPVTGRSWAACRISPARCTG